MTTLFPREIGEPEIPSIPGLTYLPSYINQKGEDALAAAIDNQPWDSTWKRRRQLYGESYGYADKLILPIPKLGQVARQSHAR